MELSTENLASGWISLSTTSSVGAYIRQRGNRNRLLVTFDALLESNHSRTRIPGDSIALKCGADHAHVATTHALWFQDAQIHDIIYALGRLAESYDEILLYGHSMGAYAALLLSGPLKATRVLAFAPQYSVDPEKTPFEDRFSGYTAGMSFFYDDMKSSISNEAVKVIVFDPYCRQDNLHYKLYSRHEQVIPLRIPFAGHYPAQMLNEAGCLADVVISLLLGEANTAALRRKIRLARRKSHRYFVERSIHVARRGNLKQAIKLVNSAYLLAPDNPSVLETYQALLHFDEAYYGIAHAIIRLIKLERPGWSHYDSELQLLWRELKKHSLHLHASLMDEKEKRQEP